MFCGIHLGAISQASVLYNEFEKCTFETYYRGIDIGGYSVYLSRNVPWKTMFSLSAQQRV